MGERILAFDVETPNSANDRMSALGAALIENGTVVSEFYSLVNPEVRFDPFNIALTGITPAAVANQPTFPELWKTLAPLMEGCLLAAHNAPFDMGVLGKCLRAYGLRWQNTVPYVCTCRMGRRLMPELPNHRLDTMCAALGVDLNHHHAGSDSRACGELLLRYLRDGAALEPFIRIYDLSALRTLQGRGAAKYTPGHVPGERRRGTS